MKMRRKLRDLAMSLAALAALAAVVAGPAAASELSAKFSDTSMKVATTGITIKKGTESKACTLSPNGQGSVVSGSTALVYNGSSGELLFNCAGGSQLAVFFNMEAKYDTVTAAYTLKQCCNFRGGEVSPWGLYTNGNSLKGTWTNGSGATNSTVAFTEAVAGHLNSTGQAITLTGTFTATTATGGLLTLSH